LDPCLVETEALDVSDPPRREQHLVGLDLLAARERTAQAAGFTANFRPPATEYEPHPHAGEGASEELRDLAVEEGEEAFPRVD
jgi:hypothetical protein